MRGKLLFVNFKVEIQKKQSNFPLLEKKEVTEIKKKKKTSRNKKSQPSGKNRVVVMKARHYSFASQT